MSKFDLESRDKIGDELLNSVPDSKDRQTLVLAYAQTFLLNQADIVDLSTKEILLLNFYVRKALEDYSKVGLRALPAEEAARNWFLHVTGYNIEDFRKNMGNGPEDLGLPNETGKLIDILREKFNRGDDQTDFS